MLLQVYSRTQIYPSTLFILLLASFLFNCLAMAYVGILNVPETVGDMEGGLLAVQTVHQDTKTFEAGYFRFSRMIQQFIRDWVTLDPSLACHYVFLIGLYGVIFDFMDIVTSFIRGFWIR